MTRFNISLSEGVEMVMGLKVFQGRRNFVPKIPSYRITDIASAIAPSCKQEIVGIRPGEKLHEEMITSSDSQSTIDLGDYYAILPTDGRVHDIYKKMNVLFSEVLIIFHITLVPIQIFCLLIKLGPLYLSI